MKLRHHEDIRTLAFVGIYFFLVVAQWFDWITFGGSLVILPVLTCVFSFFGAVITHNTVHSPVFESARINRMFQVVLSLTYGSAVSAFVPGHNLSHHRYMQGAKDVMRTTKVRHRWNLLNLFEFAPRVAVSIIKNDLRFVDQMKRRRSPWFRQYMMESWAVILVTAVLLVLDWQKALLVWLIPHIYAAWGIITINYLQHDGCDPDHPYNHSRNFVGRTVNWWTFNNGLHGVHHNNPGLHWSRARQEHERLMVPNMDPRLNEASLVLYLLRAFIWPGIRTHYDGTEIPLPPRVADESWVPENINSAQDMGAVGT